MEECLHANGFPTHAHNFNHPHRHLGRITGVMQQDERRGMC
jgi:hypothetical protein